MGATDLSPADFPLGSPESRAIARSMLDKIQRRVQANGAVDPAVEILEGQRIYEPKYIRDRYGIVDPVAEA